MLRSTFSAATKTVAGALLAFVSLSVPAPSQDIPAAADQPAAAVPGGWLVRFDERSFDLEPFRRAIRGRAAPTEVASVVEDMEARVRRDQAAFVAAVEGLGGRVTKQWWIINGAAVRDVQDPGRLAELPNVVAVEPDWLHWPTNNTARNSANHEADQANQRRNAAGALVDGTGVSVAVLDTGVDAQYGSTGRPHAAYYVDGNVNNTSGGGIMGSRLKAVFGTSGTGSEDQNGHGSHVSGSVASGWSAYRGIAPRAWIVGVKISGSGTSGSASGSAIISGWQLVAAQRATHEILVGNNSFSGSPSLTSSVQMALDNTAFNADVLICCSAGNRGGNTGSSQNTWNGLAVAATEKNSWSAAGFSARGPLDNFGRTYPDIAGVGVGVRSIRPNSTSSSSKNGTSMSSPMVAGGAALLRQAVPSLTAHETKAILLNTTKGIQTSRNTYGLGFMDCDAAVAQALAGEYYSIDLPNTSRTYQRTFSVPSTRAMDLTAVWMHRGGAAFDNIDMRILDGTTVVAQDAAALNSYAHVDFNATGGRSYTLELTWVGAQTMPSLEIAIAGLAEQLPTLAAIAPTSVLNSGTPSVTVTGTGLDTVASVSVAGQTIENFTVGSAGTRLTFTMPSPFLLGTHPVTVMNGAGASNALSLDVDPTIPAILTSGTLFAPRGGSADLTVIGRDGYNSILLFSLSGQPSTIPGIVDLEIGAGFTQLFSLVTLPHDARGAAEVAVPVPATSPSGLAFFEAVTFDPAMLGVPVETTNALQLLIF